MATLLAEDGASRREIRHILGHESLNTSQAYILATANGSTLERRAFDRQPSRHLPRPLVELAWWCRRDFRAPRRSYRYTCSRKHSPPTKLSELEGAPDRTLAPARVTNK